MSKSRSRWFDRDFRWFIWTIVFGAFPFLASLLIELSNQDFQCCAFIKSSDVAASGLALFLTNFNLVGIGGKKHSEKRLTLVLFSVAGIFLMGVCTAVVGLRNMTGGYFDMALYILVAGSIMLSYASNRYVFCR